MDASLNFFLGVRNMKKMKLFVFTIQKPNGEKIADHGVGVDLQSVLKTCGVTKDDFVVLHAAKLVNS